MEITMRWTGRNGLLMHNSQLANPLNEYTRELAKLTSKRGKTEEDHRQIGDMEFIGSLYINSSGPYIPDSWVSAAIRDGAKLSRNGKNIERGLVVQHDWFSLEYSGPRTLSELTRDANFRRVDSVKVQTSRTMRTRPFFPEWSVEIAVALHDDIMDLDTFQQVVRSAGQFVGIGDWRPRYGRFDVEFL